MRTIDLLRQLFASYGLPEEVVSDNEPQFISTPFADFMRLNGIRHTRSAPYHPATNGAAERLVQNLERSLKNADPHLSKEHQLSNFLMTYRCTPHTATGASPAQLFIKRQLCTRLALVKPDPESTMQKKKQQQDQETKPLRSFQSGDHVAVRQFRGPEKWALGIVVQRLSPVGYMIRMAHETCHVHVDHLIPAPDKAELPDNTRVAVALPELPGRPPGSYAEVHSPAYSPGPTPEILPLVPEEPARTTPDIPATPVTPTVNPEQTSQGRRYSARTRRPRRRLDLKKSIDFSIS